VKIYGAQWKTHQVSVFALCTSQKYIVIQQKHKASITAVERVFMRSEEHIKRFWRGN